MVILRNFRSTYLDFPFFPMFCVVTMEIPGNSTEEKTLTNQIPNLLFPHSFRQRRVEILRKFRRNFPKFPFFECFTSNYIANHGILLLPRKSVVMYMLTQFDVVYERLRRILRSPRHSYYVKFSVFPMFYKMDVTPRPILQYHQPPFGSYYMRFSVFPMFSLARRLRQIPQHYHPPLYALRLENILKFV